MIGSSFGFAGGEDGFIARSEDGGRSWVSEYSGREAVIYSVAGLTEGGELVAFAVGSGGTITRYRSLLSTGRDETDGKVKHVYTKDYAGSQFEIEMPGAGKTRLAIFNSAGKRVMEKNLIESGREVVSLVMLTSGMYYYMIYFEGGLWGQGKIWR
jgi:hypothetical protein